jgi:hypothetical protein
MPIVWRDGEAVDISDEEFGPIPVLPNPAPAAISDRQFAQGLAAAGMISEAEAEEWVGPGIVPAVLLALVEGLPDGGRFAARMLLRGATSFERSHPLTNVLAAAYGWTAEQTDQFWRECALL